MHADELLSDPAAPAVDATGTVWVYRPAIDGWKYITDEGLSYDWFKLPPDHYGPFTPLDEGAARMITRAVAALATT
ncbi:hypothetical protein SEA_TYPHA_112 [Mycobacterium phage Typha]|uniref:Uncharacterized protein n=1 Tax=Mycobacterium phage Typha TaxID=2517971 RepID=A0A482J6X5_9CAUD|nr:hypothetical protein KCH40_gp057 [Mycobacterium phage Typha]QBP29767.1 hypothetical protein SEA_TYPHA_112 [Mycobacterium phage Typha]URM86553.1 hypothetical protein PBI_HILLTOPFARM_115 [Mycobacterium phage Hilltopfarm]